MTFVDRATRCIVSWRVIRARTGIVVQEMVHKSAQPQRDFSDGLEVYQTALYWPAVHYPMHDKRETSTQLRAITLNCVTTSLALPAALVASYVANRLKRTPSSSSSMRSIAAN